MVGVFDFREETPADKGLGGKLAIRPSPRGGCGKEFMLTTFLIVLPALLSPEADLGCGKEPVGAGVVGGRKAADGARNPVLGVDGVDLVADVGTPPVLFRVLPTGRAGRAIVGGPFDGRDGLGSVADMMTFCREKEKLWGLGRSISAAEFLKWKIWRDPLNVRITSAGRVVVPAVRSQIDPVPRLKTSRAPRRAGVGGV